MKHLKDINSYIKESNKVNLVLVIKDDETYNKALNHFEQKSEFYPHKTNDEFNSIYFETEGQNDADITEKSIEMELIDNNIENFYFEIE